MNQQLASIKSGLEKGMLIPFLGPECLPLADENAFPSSPAALAAALEAKVAVPARTRGNVWADAQFIESRRHRKTLEKLMAGIFAAPPAINDLQRWLSSLSLPLIVDAWYDDVMAHCLSGDWGQIQAVTRNGRREDIWFRAIAPDGSAATLEDAAGWQTILYKPHGAVKPACEFLLSDSDYVEVLTEIDIQTPIPQAVIDRRSSRGFVFFGCRFSSQTERIFARQIIKRSQGPHSAIIAGELTRNEQRFLDELHIARIDMPLTEAVSALTA